MQMFDGLSFKSQDFQAFSAFFVTQALRLVFFVFFCCPIYVMQMFDGLSFKSQDLRINTEEGHIKLSIVRNPLVMCTQV